MDRLKSARMEAMNARAKWLRYEKAYHWAQGQVLKYRVLWNSAELDMYDAVRELQRLEEIEESEPEF